MLNEILERSSQALGAVVASAKPAAETETAQALTLSVPRWNGRQRLCRVKVLKEDGAELTVWSPERLEPDDIAWVDGRESSVQCVVRKYVASAGGYRLTLERKGGDRRADKRMLTDLPADMEWSEGLNLRHCAVRVTNVSNNGAQVTLAEPTADLRSVRLRVGGRVYEGSVRYCVQLGASYLAGIQFA